MKNWIHFLGGSVSVYLLMAACSAGSKHGSGNERPQATANQGGMGTATGGADVVANAGTSSPNGTSGDGAAAGLPAAPGGGLGGMIGGMMDPVDEADAAPATSGTRLRARYYVGEDGSKQFIGWHDKTRNEDCYFARVADGALRCTPLASASQPVFFGDPGCSTQPISPVAKASSACTAVAAPKQHVYAADGCGANRQQYTLAAQPFVGAVYQKGTGTCTDVTQYLQPTYDFYAMTSPTPAPDSAFVAATEQVE